MERGSSPTIAPSPRHNFLTLDVVLSRQEALALVDLVGTVEGYIHPGVQEYSFFMPKVAAALGLAGLTCGRPFDESILLAFGVTFGAGAVVLAWLKLHSADGKAKVVDFLKKSIGTLPFLRREETGATFQPFSWTPS